MMRHRRHRTSTRPSPEPDLDGALDALTADELRSLVRDALRRLDEKRQHQLVDSVISQAAKGSAGWKPRSPSTRLADEVEGFTDAARRIGFADADDVDDYLRRGAKAFLAGELATARQVFETLLPPIADVDIDLGQHELIEEVLTVDIQEVAAQYLVSVYATTDLPRRAEALSSAIDTIEGIASFWELLAQMESVCTGPLPDLPAFLPRWVAHLRRQPSPVGEWGHACDRWLREAVLRLEGLGGLERLARRTKQPEALRAWCDAVVDQEDWGRALVAYDAAAALAGQSFWRGHFLDGAALAARELGRRDATKRLERAWLGAPSPPRLLRWLGAGSPSAATRVRRAKQATTSCPSNAGPQVGLLHLLTGRLHSAAKLLETAPGLGWSSEDHPGHLLFPGFAGLLGAGTGATVASDVAAVLEVPPLDPLDQDHGLDIDMSDKPTLDTPSVAELIIGSAVHAGIDTNEKTALLEALRVAATRRVEGILTNKRRRHYGPAATLVACCLELAPVVGREEAIGEWVADLRKKYSRFSAFQGALNIALQQCSAL